MTEQEITWHYRLWIMLCLVGIFTILLTDRFEMESKLNTIAQSCSPYTLTIPDDEIDD